MATWLCLLVPILLFSTTYAGHHHHHEAAKQCRVGCKHTLFGSSFHYESGHNYVYSFDTVAETTLSGSTSEPSRVRLTADADISVQQECSYYLTLKNIQVEGPDGEQYSTLKGLEGNPVKFSYQDGIVDDQICTQEEVQPAGLNVKRGIISLLQVATFSGVKVTETDIFGVCPTQYKTTRDGSDLIITKSRDLNTCVHRESVHDTAKSVPYYVSSDFQSLPLTSGEQHVEQRINHGIIQNVLSKEQYQYRPFSNQDKGARTVVTTRLELKSHQESAFAPPAISTPRSILFDHHATSSSSDNPNALLQALKRAYENVAETVRPGAARSFARLVHVLHGSTKENILSVYNQARSGAGFPNSEAAKKLFSDALLSAGTGETVRAIAELLKNGEITGLRAKVFYVSFGLAKHPNKASLHDVAELLDGDAPKSAYLGIGALADRYCSQHGCENLPEYEELLNKLAARLGTNCQAGTHQNEDQVIVALKAIGNAGHLTNSVAQTLQHCIADHSLSARVRVAALEATRKDTCNQQVREAAVNVLKDREEDSEIRIKAYLLLADCPCGRTANALKDLLDTEPINQVGAFIVSHLNNLRKSSNPDKAHSQKVLREVKARKRFPHDHRKFSHQHELSYVLEILNVGFSSETDVIYSQKSYIPRSVNFNLTTYMFGHAVNLFDVNARVENVEYILEAFFGPKGYLKGHDLNEVLSTGKENLLSIAEKIRSRAEQSYRSKRSITKAQLDENYQKSHIPDPDHDVTIDLSAKFFNQELIYYDIHGNTHDLNPDHIIDKVFEVVDKLIDGAKNYKRDRRHYFSFLDTVTSYPTAGGLPLQLEASGKAAINVDIDGSVDVRSILKNPRNIEAHLKLIPSSSVEISGLMSVDAYAVEAGLRLVTSLHSSTGVDLTVKTLGGKGIDVNVGLPLPKQEIIDLKTELFKVKHVHSEEEVETPLALSGKRKDYSGCFDQLAPITGLTVCGEVGFPYEGLTRNSPYFPLDGPSRLLVRLEKEDASLNSYHFRALYNAKGRSRSLELLFDTPGSQIDRTLAVTLEGSSAPNKEVKLSIRSPFGSASAQGAFINNDAEHSLSGTLDLDGAEYYGRIGLQVSSGDSRKVFVPLFEYKTPDHSASLVQGDVTYEKGKEVVFNLKPAGSDDYALDGKITLEADQDTKKYKYGFDAVRLTTPIDKYGVDGYISRDGSLYGLDLTLLFSNLQSNVNYKSTFQDFGDANDVHIKTSSQFLLSDYRDLGIATSLELQVANGKFINDFAFVHGADPQSEVSRLSLHQSLIYNIDSLDSLDVKVKTSASYPLLGFELSLQGGATRKSVNYDALLNYEQLRLASHLDAKVGEHHAGDAELHFKLEAVGNVVTVEAKREVKADDQSQITFMAEISPGGKIELTSDIIYKCDPGDVNIQGDTLLKISGDSKEYRLKGGVTANSQLSEAHGLLTAGDVNYIEFLASVAKTPGAPTGTLRLNAKHYLDIQGNFQITNVKGNALLEINLLKSNKRIHGAAEYTKRGTKYRGNAEILFNADQNPKQKVRLETVTDFSDAGHIVIDSKNTIIIIDRKFNVNGKANIAENYLDGESTGEIDLQHGRHQFAAKGKAILHARKGDSEGEVNLEISHTGATTTQSITIHQTVKHYDAQFLTLVTNGDVTVSLAENSNIRTVYGLTHKVEGRDRTIGAELQIDGSLVPSAIAAELSAQSNEHLLSVKSSGRYQDSNFEHNLKLKCEESHKEGESHLVVHLPLEYLKELRLENSFSLEGTSSQQLDFKTENEIQYDGKTIKAGGELELKDHHTTKGHVTLVLPDNVPRTVTFSGTINADTPGVTGLRGAVGVNLGDNHEVKLDAATELRANAINLHLTLETPDGTYNRMEILLDHKRDGNLLESDVTVVLGSDRTNVKSKVEVGPPKYSIDLIVTNADKQITAFGSVELKSLRHVVVEVRSNFVDGYLTGDGEARLESLEDFEIRGNLDSPYFEINKYHLEINTKAGAKAGRGIAIKIKEQNQNILTGSGSIQRKEDANSIVYEGQANIKYMEETYKPSFTVTYNILTEAQEQGRELKLEASAPTSHGKATLRTEFKVSNREFRYFDSFCDNRGCSEVQLVSRDRSEGLMAVDYELSFIANIEPHYDISIPSFIVTTKSQRLTFEHKLEVRLKDAQNNPGYRVYVQPQEAGIVLTLLQHESAAVATYSENAGNIRGDVNIYLDRTQQPDLKTTLTLIADRISQGEGIGYNLEGRIHHPELSRDILGKGAIHLGGQETILDANFDLDLFSRKNQKISVIAKIIHADTPRAHNLTSTFEIKSRGLNLDIELRNHLAAGRTVLGAGSLIRYGDGTKEAGILYESSLDKFILYIYGPNGELAHIDADIHLSSALQKLNADIEIAGIQPAVAHGEINDLQSFSYSIYRKNQPENLLQATGGVELGKAIELKAVQKLGSETNQLLKILISLEQSHFLKTEFDFAQDRVGNILESARNELLSISREAKTVTEALLRELTEQVTTILESLAKAQTNLKPVLTSYHEQLRNIQQDQAIQEIKEKSAYVYRLIRQIAGGIVETIRVFISESVHIIIETAEQAYERFGDVRELAIRAYKQYAPKVRSIIVRLSSIATDIAIKLADIGLQILQVAIEELKGVAEYFREFIEYIVDIVGSVARVVIRRLNEVKIQIREAFDNLIEILKALPIVEYYNEFYAEYAGDISEQLEGIYRDIIEAVKDFLPTSDLRELFGAVIDYLEKKVKREPIEDLQELKAIYYLFMKTVRSIVTELSEYGAEEGYSFSKLSLPLALESLKQIPNIIRQSLKPIQFALNYNDILDYYYTYRPSRDIADIFPPFKAYAVMIGAHHFVTFDRKHFTLDGECQYVLAQDLVDGNFSLALDRSGGSRSIVFSDGHDIVELKADNTVLLNGETAQLPIHHNDFSVHGKPHFIVVKNKNGIHYHCDRVNGVCVFHASGFYFGKTRGLLGTINNEHYDDFTLPNGHVSSNAGEFASSYALGQCGSSPADDHEHTHNTECTKFFTGYSPLKYGFPIVNPAGYREACDAIASESDHDGRSAACKAAAAYVTACREQDVYLQIPDGCAHCTIEGEEVQPGYSKKIEGEHHSADVLFLVEQAEENEEVYNDLITKLVGSLSNDLKQQNIEDVKYTLIGFGGPGQHGPEYYSAGGSTSYDGKVSNIQFTPTPQEHSNLYLRYLKIIQRYLYAELGITDVAKAFIKLQHFLFRPGASRAVVAVLQSSKVRNTYNPISPLSFRVRKMRNFLLDHGIALHVVIPVNINSPSVTDKKEAKLIIGYDDTYVYRLNDAKKRQLEGDASLRTDLQHDDLVVASLAEDTYGSVFSSRSFHELNKPAQRKQFLQVVSLRVAQSLQPESCQECECVIQHGLHAETECRLCHRRERQRPAGEAAALLSGAGRKVGVKL